MENINQIHEPSLLPESKLKELTIDLFALVDMEKDTSLSYSNTFANIDLVPRFVRGSGNNVVPVALAESQNLIIENRYEVNGCEFICRVKPTIIEREENGKIIQFHAHPGEREEIIEKVLFKLACSDGLTKLPMAANRWGVRFSLYQIREELKKINKTRSYHEIRESLIILRDSKTTIAQIVGKREIELTASIFTDAAFEVSGTGRARDKYFIVLADYVVEQIINFNYRQYPFEAINSHAYSLARFFHIFIKHHWINASIGQTKDFSLNQIYQNYGNANQRPDWKRRDFRKALSILQEAGWIVDVPPAKKVKNIFQKKMNQEFDYIYTLTPTKKFVEEVRKANAKIKGIKTIVSKTIETGRIPELEKRVFVHVDKLENDQTDND